MDLHRFDTNIGICQSHQIGREGLSMLAQPLHIVPERSRSRFFCTMGGCSLAIGSGEHLNPGKPLACDLLQIELESFHGIPRNLRRHERVYKGVSLLILWLYARMG